VAVLRAAPEPSLRERVAEELSESRHYAQVRVKKWMLFWAELGYTKLFLDECPGLPVTANLKALARWLEEEGFRVKVPRLGRITIYLGEPDE
jgi:hypothetical protein